MSISNQIVANAREWLGTPWQHNQKCKGYGVDCVQLVLASIDSLNVDAGNPYHYYRTPIGNSLKDYLSNLKSTKEVSTIQAGTLLLFKIAGIPHHVAIATSETSMIHASNSLGVIEHSIGKNWMKRLTTIYEVISNG